MTEGPLSSAKSTSIAIWLPARFSWKIWMARSSPRIAADWPVFHVNPVDLNIGMTAYLLMLAVSFPSALVCRPLRRAYGVCIRHRGLYIVSHPVRPQRRPLGIHRSSRHARHWSADDGSCRAPGRVAHHEKHNLIHSITYITWPGLVAPVVGPPVGGFITTYASWHWIFFLNVAARRAGGCTGRVLDPEFPRRALKPFDWLGFVLCGTDA